MENFTVNEVQLSYSRKGNPDIQIDRSQTAADVLRAYIDPGVIDHKEYFYLICLSNSNKIQNISTVAIGGIDMCVVDKRVIFQTALLSNAKSIIIAHNHPSGSLNPSSQDIKITREVKEAGDLLSIKLFDHIIITTESYFSFADECLI